MLSASIYERDNRVLRYAESLMQRGDAVDVIALGEKPDVPATGTVGGASIWRIGLKSSAGGQLAQLRSALSFLVRSSLRLLRNHRRQPYDLIHVHNMPDFLVFAAWWPKLRGARIMLDIHDIFPEFYATRFGRSMETWLPRLLCAVERACARFADHVIISNHLWRDTFVARSSRAERCSVFINSVDTERFHPRSRTRSDDRFVIVYPGSFNWHQGLDVAIRAYARVRADIPGAELHLYGRGPEKTALIRLAGELQLNGGVRFFDPLPLDQIPQVLADADVGIVPKRASNFFGNQAFSTKIMEFMSQGLPVVASSTDVDRYYYDDSVIRFVESENPEQLAHTIVELASDSSARTALATNGRRFVEKNCWNSCRQDYLNLVDSLLR